MSFVAPLSLSLLDRMFVVVFGGSNQTTPPSLTKNEYIAPLFRPCSAPTLAKPRFDQSTYVGRVRHFIQVTSPLNLFVTGRGLEDAKTLIREYNQGQLPANIDPNKLWRAKESKWWGKNYLRNLMNIGE